MKAFEPHDPMELVGIVLPQEDEDYMAECLVEEYLLLGWNDGQLMSLFTSPFFLATHRIYHDKGEAYVRSIMQRVQNKWSRGWIQRGEPNA